LRLPIGPKSWVPIAALALLLSSSFLSPAFHSVYGFASGESGGTVLGQPNFNSTVSPSNGLRQPSNFVFDSSGNLWVADAEDNRIVEETGLGAGQTPAIGVVLGQSSLETGAGALTQTGIANPSGMAFDSAGDLWLADTNNSRVLEFAAPFTSGEAASVVIGQRNYTSIAMLASAGGLKEPGAVTFDSHGDLWVVDGGDNRVLEYEPPFTNGMNASLVLGQPDLATVTNSTTQGGMDFPASARFDSSGNLWVSDAGNNRVLEYRAPSASGMNATLVLGQPGFTTNAHAAAQSGLYIPQSLAFDSSGDLWVTDSFNDRVLEFDAPFSDGMQASTVLGQATFTSTATATTRSGLDLPSEVGFDKAGDLWVADLFNNRILEFAPPFQNGAQAYRVLGQSDFVSDVFGGEAGLYRPMSVAFDSSGNLWTADRGDNRVVEYKAPVSIGENASIAIGQPSLTLSKAGGGASGLSTPTDAVFDSSGDLWVSDTLNSRVLEFTPPFTTGMNATLAIGQPTFSTDSPSAGQKGLDYPSEIAFDTSGDLWVADTGNARVLEFVPPFTTGMSATLVLGQSSFSTSSPGASAGSLGEPTGLAFDAKGNIWVSDVYENVVVAFSRPFSSGETSTLVLQGGLPTLEPTQSGFVFPYSIVFDQSGDLWLSDSFYNRVLRFAAPVEPGAKPSLVIGQGSFTSGAPGTSQTSLAEPLGIALDSSGNLWVADWANNRLMEFPGATIGSVTSSSTSSSSSTKSSTNSSSTTTTTHSSSSTSSAKSSSSTTLTTTSTLTSASTSTTASTASTLVVPPSTTSTASSPSSSSASKSTAPSNGGIYYILAGVAVVVVVVIVAGALLRRNRQPWRY
jgi:sugar lactone lactonase YvrE